MNKLINVDALASAQTSECSVFGDPEGDAVFVDWCPGNGTRYQVVFSRIPAGSARVIGCSDEAVLVSWVAPYGKGRSYPFSGFAHASYVKEHLNPSYDGDVLALAALITLALESGESGVRYANECLDQACGRAA